LNNAANDINKLLKNKEFDQMLSMDCRESSQNSRPSNSKVIMAKQFFETMTGSNCNLPRQ